MKKLKELEDFNVNESDESVDESIIASVKRSKDAPDKAKFRFEVSDNLKKVSKIEKALIDVNQMLVDMSDEIVALKVGFPNMDPESMKIMNNMAYNIKNMMDTMNKVRKSGSKTGLVDNKGRLKRNMKRLKTEYISKT